MKPAHRLSNVKTALDYLKKRKVRRLLLTANLFQVKLVNVNPVDIVDGRPKIVLGLIWIIILYFQVTVYSF